LVLAPLLEDVLSYAVQNMLRSTLKGTSKENKK
jgi:hypothetical protein